MPHPPPVAPRRVRDLPLPCHMPLSLRHATLWTLRHAFAGALALLAQAAAAAPHLPARDDEVVEHVPARLGDARVRELEALRAASRADPNDVTLAVRLARRYFDRAGAEGDPRYVGYAQAALAPWWSQPAPPTVARVQRAVLRQYGHQFAEALADLEAVSYTHLTLPTILRV